MVWSRWGVKQHVGTVATGMYHLVSRIGKVEAARLSLSEAVWGIHRCCRPEINVFSCTPVKSVWGSVGVQETIWSTWRKPTQGGDQHVNLSNSNQELCFCANHHWLSLDH